MPKSPISIGLVQLDIAWEQPAKNLLKLEEMLREFDPVPDIIFLPEMFTTGFTMNAMAMAESMDGNAVQWMKETSAQMQCDLVGSLIIKEDSHYYNRLVWMGLEGIRGSYDKRHLFTMAGEDRVFTAGNERLLVQKSGWNFYPFICYDVRFPVWSRVGRKADVMVFVANFPEKRISAWTHLLIARAIENQCYVVGLNRIGYDGKNNYYNGASVVLDPLGEIILTFEEREMIDVVSLDGVQLELIRQDLPFLNDADQYQII